MSNLLKNAILKTAHYADIFDYPLKSEEIQKYLIGESVVSGVEETLSPTDQFFCLPGRKAIIELRRQRQIYSQPKLRKAKRVTAALKSVPWIRLIGVTGALAMENSDEDDDIDLMIITSPKRLWLTRGLVVTFLRLTGQYRRPGKIKDRICPNLMIGEDALEFVERDLFTAHEIVQMKPIFSRDNTYQRFLQANEWVREFLPNAIESAERKVQSAKSSSKLKTTKSFLNLLENTAYKLQLKFMESKKTTETTTPSVIRFHPKDIRQRILDEYQKRVYYLTK